MIIRQCDVSKRDVTMELRSAQIYYTIIHTQAHLSDLGIAL